MLDFTYYNPVKLIFGEGKMNEVIEEIKSYGSKVLMVFGGESFLKNGYYESFVKALEEAGIIHYEMGGNRSPLLSTARKGIDLCRKEEIDCVLGIGGGTCMDLAKTIAFGVKQSDDIWEYLTYSAKPDTMEYLPVGCIVTYPSSGSDMDGAAQITNDETKEQAGLSDIFPNFSWLNPAYMSSIGVRALTEAQITSFVQVSMAYLGLERSVLAEKIALLLIDTILENIHLCVNASHAKEARNNLMMASALNVNGLTNLGKAGDWSLYPIEGIIQNYYGVGYKSAIIILFPYWVKHVYGGQDIFKDYFKNVFDVNIDGKSDQQILEEGLEQIFTLYRKYGIAVSFAELKDRKEDIALLKEMVAAVGPQESIYTEFTLEKIEKLMLDSIYGEWK